MSQVCEHTQCERQSRKILTHAWNQRHNTRGISDTTTTTQQNNNTKNDNNNITQHNIIIIVCVYHKGDQLVYYCSNYTTAGTLTMRDDII